MPPASAVNNNSNNAALQAAAKAEREEKLRFALREFILQERRRKKEEFEAKVEEERLRKEREARERQNDMTLEETRGQIAKLDKKLTELRNQKQQLFLQLKKVLNEDENRKKQQKDNEIFAMQQALQAQVLTPQVFMPPMRVQPHQMPILPKPLGNQPVKRGRSPSPPQHQGFYKGTNYAQQKHDDGRRGADFARVLWNKPPSQYQNPGTLFYQTTSNAPPPSQAQTDARLQPLYAYGSLRREGYHLELQPNSAVPVSKSDPQSTKQPTQVFHINLDQPPISQTGSTGVSSSATGLQSQKPQVTMEKINERYHIEVKHEPTAPGHVQASPHTLQESVYTPLLTDMPMHPNVLQISGANPTQNPKSTGSITQGYAPGRGGNSHEQQLARQQLSVLPGQQSSQQQLHFARRLY